MALDLGTRIARLRIEKDLSQEALANELGISRQAVSRWERGEALPDTENLIALADLFGVTLDELVRQKEPEPKPEQEYSVAETVIDETPNEAAQTTEAPPPPPDPVEEKDRWTAGRVLILIGSILIFLGCLGMLAHRLSGPSGEPPFVSAFEDPGSHVDIGGEDVRDLSISYPRGGIHVQSTGNEDLGDSIRVFQLSGETGIVIELPTWTLEDGTLRIEGPNGRDADQAQLYVYIPGPVMSRLESVGLEIGTGVLIAQGLSCRDLQVSVGSGSAYLNEAQADTVGLVCGSGYVLFGEGSAAREVAISIASGGGDIVVADARFMPSSIDANVASGDLTFTLPRDCGFTVTALEAFENVFVEFNCTWSDEAIVYGSGDTQIELSVGSGTVSILHGE